MALKVDEEQPHSPSAKLILRASAPWSPTSHSLWDRKNRQRAVELCVAGHLIARRLVEEPSVGAFVDVWLFHVMPLALTREG